MRLLDWTCVVLIAHFLRLLLRAFFIARHQAYDSTRKDIATGLGLTRIEARTLPAKGQDVALEVKNFEVPDEDAVTWKTRQKVFWAQFLTN